MYIYAWSLTFLTFKAGVEKPPGVFVRGAVRVVRVKVLGRTSTGTASAVWVSVLGNAGSGVSLRLACDPAAASRTARGSAHHSRPSSGGEWVLHGTWVPYTFLNR